MSNLTRKLSWLLTMAWRDSRNARGRLLLFAASIAMGVGSIVLIESFAENLQSAVNEQAKSLLGADLVFQNRRPFEESFEKTIAQLPAIGRAEETMFSSMGVFVKSGRTRLMQIRGISGGFPFYGDVEVSPAGAWERLKSGEPVAVVEETLLIQFGAAVGDKLKLGEQEFEVAGQLARVPGESASFGTFAPRVYIPNTQIPATNLLLPGSVSRNRVYLQLQPGSDPDALAKNLKTKLRRDRITVQTVTDRKEDLGEALANVRRYLHLATVSALLLGGLGVASAVQAHIRPRLKSAAILRCLGATRAEAFLIYVIQAIAIAVVGTALGVALGMALHSVLPGLLKDFVAAKINPEISIPAVLSAACIGFVFALLFALLPMLQTRLVPPLQAIRPPSGPWRKLDRAAIVVVLGIATAFFFLLARGADNWRNVGILSACVAGAFAFLLIASLVVRILARKMAAVGPYYLRQGVGNLFRPGNRTLLVMMVLGLGTQIVLTLRMSEDILLRDTLLGNPDEQPNLIFFDIQPDQVTEVKTLLAERKLPILQESPMVAMRLSQVKGRKVEELLKEKEEQKIPAWTLQRDYRSTYRDRLSETEEIVAGEWIAKLPENHSGSAPVSIEEGLAKDLRVTVGDELVFDVQGMEVPIRIASIRKVDWKRFQSNFFFVFPEGILEDAPQFRVVVTRAATVEDSAAAQTSMVTLYPNVSAYDLRLVIQTIRDIVDKGKGAIHFMAGITIFAGIVVLAGAAALGNEQRTADAAIFRALGATQDTVRKMHVCEDLVLGLGAGTVGAILASVTAWALATWIFEAPFSFSWQACVIAITIVTAITAAAGFLAALGSDRLPPLAVLRNRGL